MPTVLCHSWNLNFIFARHFFVVFGGFFGKFDVIFLDTPSLTSSSKSPALKLSPEASFSEVERLRKKLRSFTFADLGESKLLSQQLEDYKELHKQLKAAVQSAKMSQKISDISASRKHSPRFSNKSISVAPAQSPVSSSAPFNPRAAKLEPLLVVASPAAPSNGASAEYWTDNTNHPPSSCSAAPPGAPQATPASIESPVTVATSPHSNAAAQGPATVSSTRSLKSSDLASALEQLTFAPEFQRLCQNSATALDECEQVLQVRKQTP